MFDYDRPPMEYGRPVPVQLEDLIEKIYVAPTSPAWFRDLVTRITARYEIGVSVEQSSLDRIPEF